MKKKYINNLPKGKEVIGTGVSVEDGKLVVEIEFKDNFRPKFGDIVKVVCGRSNLAESCKRDYMICIMPDKEIPNELFDNCFFDIANVTMALDINHICAWRREFHLEEASESEKKELFDKLAEVGKKWNPNTKQLEDIRWRPNVNELYYYINSRLGIEKAYNVQSFFDKDMIEKGNCFKTVEAAQLYADKFKEMLKQSKAE